MKIKGALKAGSVQSGSNILENYTGIGMGETDGSPDYYDIQNIKFNTSNFYITQNSPNINTAIVNLKESSSGSGEPNTASNLGAGSGVFSQKVGVDLQFKSLVAGTGITLTPSSTDITIDSAGSGGFYGLSVKLDNDAESFKGINTIAFDHSNFYITQNSPNIDEVLISFREPDLGPVVASITSSSPSSTLITTLPVRSRLGIINMKVLQAFNGTPTLTIGTDADNDLVSADSEIDLTLAFSYISMFLERFEASTDLKAFFTSGGATQGQLDITVSIN